MGEKVDAVVVSDEHRFHPSHNVPISKPNWQSPNSRAKFHGPKLDGPGDSGTINGFDEKQLRANRKHYASVARGVGLGIFKGFLLLICIVALCQFVAVRQFGLDSETSFIKHYPGHYDLVYFDFFNYIYNFRHGFDSINEGIMSVFTAFPNYTSDGSILGVLKTFVNVFSAMGNCLLMPLKVVFVYPMQLFNLVLGFSISSGFSSFLQAFGSWIIPYV